MKTYRPIPTRYRTRRRFRRDWGAHLIPAPRASTARRVRGAAHLGPSERAGQRMARTPSGPLGPTPLRPPVISSNPQVDRRADLPRSAEQASAPAGATAPAHQQRAPQGEQSVVARRSAPAGSPVARQGPGGRPIHLGIFPCPSCGAPVGSHTGDCPARTRRLELAFCLLAFGGGGLWALLWLRAPEISALCGLACLAALAAYKPPPVDVGRGQSRPVPAHRRRRRRN